MAQQLTLFDLCSQYTLALTPECSYSCYGCPVKKPSYTPPEEMGHDLKSLIQEGRFFEVFPRTRVYNIAGGDPFDSPDLLPLLIFLNSEGIKIRLWTHGGVDIGVWERIIPFLDHVFLYAPAPDDALYCDIAGVDGWKNCEDVVSYLSETTLPVTLNVPIRSEVIPFLADLYEFTYKWSLPLLLHYSRSERFQTDSLAYIRRFFRIANVMIFRVSSHRTHCMAVPIPLNRRTFSFWWFVLREVVFTLYQRWNPLFFLRRWLG